MKTVIGVVFGGRSGEHEISVRSARTVVEQIDHNKYAVIPIGITNDGEWLSPARSISLFPDSTQNICNERFPGMNTNEGVVSGDTARSGLFLTSEDGSSTKIDVIFPVLHGTFGEDGTIQGFLEMADIAYVGCGVLASSCGMDKVFMKTLFRDAGLPICDYVWFLRNEWASNQEVTLTQVESKLGFPCFVKPANLGSSVGISKAVDRESLRTAIELAAIYDRKIIVEEAIDMREIECAVIGNDDPEASFPGEYIIRDSEKAFLDFTEKYSGTGNNEFVVPAPVSTELSDRIRQMAITAFKSIDGTGLARVDFFLRNDNGAVIVNEINTMPGLTDASGFPKMWNGTGKAFPIILDELIDLAIDRFNDKKQNKTIR